jgi:hypothetical protein
MKPIPKKQKITCVTMRGQLHKLSDTESQKPHFINHV